MTLPGGARAYKNLMKWLIFAALSLVLLTPSAARADAASPWFATDQGKVRLIAASAAVDGADQVTLGLEFQLAPHWKIYWRSPGDAGYPPSLDWKGSDNLAAAVIAWPAPERFSVLGLETIGYSGAVVLPIMARVVHPGAPLHLTVGLQYLTCNDICVPYETALTLDLPASGAGTAYEALIQQYSAMVPGPGGRGLTLTAATLRAGAKPVLDLRVTSNTPLVAPDAFIEGADDATFGAPKVIVGAAGETLLRVPVDGDWVSLSGRPLTVTLVDGARSATAPITPTRGPDLIDLGTVTTMIGLALLGGFILNLMPCVLPVLSLKFLAALPRVGEDRAATRRGFLATAAGVVASFLVLAAASVAFKAAGATVGWGVQFQDPLFLVFLVVALTLFACNLFGWFEIGLPRVFAALGEGRTLGNFATGAFATLLATPCSAPFLGTALGFALAAGPIEIFAIFAALGIGMASPYLAVAAMPGLVRYLPRPGAWMIHLRRALGLLLAASALWLVVVLASEIGMAQALVVAALMLVAGATLALLRDPGPRHATLAVAVVAALALPLLAPPQPPASIASARWQRFDPAAIGGMVRDGRVVMVDVTADWCLTCKLNERLVLDATEVRRALDRPQVTAMRADWTRPDPAIAAYLSRYGRYGIPFYAVYGPGAPGGLALPELLTPGAVVQALADAAGPPR